MGSTFQFCCTDSDTEVWEPLLCVRATRLTRAEYHMLQPTDSYTIHINGIHRPRAKYSDFCKVSSAQNRSIEMSNFDLKFHTFKYLCTKFKNPFVPRLVCTRSKNRSIWALSSSAAGNSLLSLVYFYCAKVQCYKLTGENMLFSPADHSESQFSHSELCHTALRVCYKCIAYLARANQEW